MDKELLDLLMTLALISLDIISFIFLIILLFRTDTKYESKSKRGDK